MLRGFLDPVTGHMVISGKINIWPMTKATIVTKGLHNACHMAKVFSDTIHA